MHFKIKFEYSQVSQRWIKALTQTPAALDFHARNYKIPYSLDEAGDEHLRQTGTQDGTSLVIDLKWMWTSDYHSLFLKINLNYGKHIQTLMRY